MSSHMISASSVVDELMCCGSDDKTADNTGLML
jgi:hypothetical protein